MSPNLGVEIWSSLNVLCYSILSKRPRDSKEEPIFLGLDNGLLLSIYSFPCFLSKLMFSWKNLECIILIPKSRTSAIWGSKPTMIVDANPMILMITNPTLGSLENTISSKDWTPIWVKKFMTIVPHQHNLVMFMLFWWISSFKELLLFALIYRRKILKRYEKKWENLLIWTL